MATKKIERGSGVVVVVEVAEYDEPRNVDGIELTPIHHTQRTITVYKDGNQITSQINYAPLYPMRAGYRIGRVEISAECATQIDAATEDLGCELATFPSYTPIKRGAGWCNRCQSYCWGDCQS